MTKKLLFSAALSALLAFGVCAQTMATFEDLSLPTDTFWNGSDTSGGFTSGSVFFTNDYNTQWASWTGFSYSSKTDTTTAGFANMYSSASGSGYNSATYGVAYVSSFGPATYMSWPASITNKEVEGFYINNSTFAYLSMLNGDAYAKKFGGASGSDPDWFKLKINGFANGSFADSVVFYLADFRSANDSLDYIIHDWTWVNINALGVVDSLTFELSSSDVGAYGMNTPAYFCMDDFLFLSPIGFTENTSSNTIKLYPNPANNILNITSADLISQVEIFSLTGAKVLNIKSASRNFRRNISELNSGIYVVKVYSEKGITTLKLVVQ